MTHYQVLGVPESADPATLRRAYRRLVKRWHPDVCASPRASGYFHRINRAYRTLIDPMQRVTYDQALQWQRSRVLMGVADRGWAAEGHRADPPRTWTPPSSSATPRGADGPRASRADRPDSSPRATRTSAHHTGGALFWLVLLAGAVGLVRLVLWPPRHTSVVQEAGMAAPSATARPRRSAIPAAESTGRTRRHGGYAVVSAAYRPRRLSGLSTQDRYVENPPAGAGSAPQAGPFSPPPGRLAHEPVPHETRPRAHTNQDRGPDGWAIPSPAGSPRTRRLKFRPVLPEFAVPNPLPDGAWGTGSVDPPR